MRKLTSTMLVVTVLTASLLLTSQPVSAQTQADFEAEIAAYAYSHTQAETAAYAQSRVNEMTIANLATSTTAGALALGETNALIFEKPDDGVSMLLRDRDNCLGLRWEACRQTYNGELFASAGISVAIFAGCNAITALTGFIVCTAGAIASHGANIAAARSRRSACNTMSVADCANR